MTFAVLLMVTTQALPFALQGMLSGPGQVAEMVASIAAGSALIEFLLLPITAAASDTFGRRPLLLTIPVAMILARAVVVWHLSLPTIILSRVLVGILTNYYVIFVGVASADLFKDDDRALAALEGKSAACWGAAQACGMLLGGAVLSSHGVRATHALSGALALAGLVFALLSRETLHPVDRSVFVIRSSHPLAFLRLFLPSRARRRTDAAATGVPAGDGSGTVEAEGGLDRAAAGTKPSRDGALGLIPCLALILALQTLHDGEGDVWQVCFNCYAWTPREELRACAAAHRRHAVTPTVTPTVHPRLRPLLHPLLHT